MKKKEIHSFVALAVAGAATYGTWWILPNAHWGVYVVVAIAVMGLVFKKFQKSFGDDDAPNKSGASQAKKKIGRSKKGALLSTQTIEALLLHISDMADGATSTSAQRTAVERMGFGKPPSDMSSDQASAILSARTYAKAVSDKVTKDYHIGNEVSKRLIAIIIADRPVLERVMKWNERSFARGGGENVSPKKDEFWEKLLQDGKKIALDLS